MLYFNILLNIIICLKRFLVRAPSRRCVGIGSGFPLQIRSSSFYTLKGIMRVFHCNPSRRSKIKFAIELEVFKKEVLFNIKIIFYFLGGSLKTLPSLITVLSARKFL